MKDRRASSVMRDRRASSVTGDRQAPSVMRDRQPPSDDEIREYVKQILECADLELTTMRTVYTQVYNHYPDFDLTHKKAFIIATTKSIIELEPSDLQLEKLVQFLEQNPQIATGPSCATNELEGNWMKETWEAAAQDINAIRGANRSAESWAQYWYGKRIVLERTIRQRRRDAGSQSGTQQPRLADMLERMIVLLERPKPPTEVVLAEPTSTTESYEDSEQAAEVDDDVQAEATGHAPQPTHRAASEPPPSSSGRARRRRQRRAAQQRPARTADMKLQITLQHGSSSEDYMATIDCLSEFLIECGRSIARDQQRRHTPN